MKKLNFFRKKKRKQRPEDEAEIEVVGGSWSKGYSDDNDPDDRDPEEFDPNMRKIGGDFVIPSE